MRRDTEPKVEKLLGFSVKVLCDDGVERTISYSDIIRSRQEGLDITATSECDGYYYRTKYNFNLHFECDGFLAQMIVFEE